VCHDQLPRPRFTGGSRLNQTASGLCWSCWAGHRRTAHGPSSCRAIMWLRLHGFDTWSGLQSLASLLVGGTWDRIDLASRLRCSSSTRTAGTSCSARRTPRQSCYQPGSGNSRKTQRLVCQRITPGGRNSPLLGAEPLPSGLFAASFRRKNVGLRSATGSAPGQLRSTAMWAPEASLMVL